MKKLWFVISIFLFVLCIALYVYSAMVKSELRKKQTQLDENKSVIDLLYDLNSVYFDSIQKLEIEIKEFKGDTISVDN